MDYFSTTHDTDRYEVWSDEELLSASRQKPWLFAYLVQRYEKPFLRKVQSIIFNSIDAEEVVLDPFTKIYLHADSFAPQTGATFSSWAYRILLNTAFTRYQKIKNLHERTTTLDPEFEWLLRAPLPDTDTVDMVTRIIAQLPPALATVLRLYYLERWPQQDIADSLGISVGAVKVRVFRAKQSFGLLYEKMTKESK